MINFAGIIYTNGSKVLLLRRSEKSNKGKWDIPGGHIEDEENTLDAAERESKEEINTVKGKRIYKFNNPSVYVYKVEKEFDPVLNKKEHDLFRWVNLNDVANYELHPGFKRNWDKYLEKLSAKSFKEWLGFFKFIDN